MSVDGLPTPTTEQLVLKRGVFENLVVHAVLA